MPNCEGCGYEYDQEEMAVLPVLVNLKDGTQRDVHFCGDVCADFWDYTGPSEWVALHSGEEVQRVSWQCDVCDQVWTHTGVKALIDMDNFDPDDPGDPLENALMAECIVCASCQKKEKDRFKTTADIGL